MAQVINTNIMSLNSQRNLNRSGSSMATSLQRLSSGLRINSAKDDAAGLAISERFTTQVRGLNQAVRNANDGISFAQTAEGALGSVGDSLQRIRELAVQATNDTNSASDRQALNNEVDQLISEVNRIAMSTEFNGGRVLDGTQSSLFFQVGANEGQTISVDGVDSRTSQLGARISVGAAGLTQDQINDVGIASFADVTITDNDTVDPHTDITVDMTGVTTMEDAVRAINEQIDTEVAAGDANAELVADDGYRASLRVNNDGTTSIAITANFRAESAFTVTGGAATLDDTASTVVEVTAPGAAATQTNLTDLSVTTRADAQETIAAVTGALTQVNNLRADLGSVQTRFESTIGNLEIGSENLSAARSRIRDTDFAAETAELTRVQILQQAGVAMLSQANSAPQSVLALLQ